MNIIGEVAGRTCVIMDDMVDTAGTLIKAAQALKNNGATKVIAYCTHAVLSGPAIERLSATDSGLDELVVTDTIPLTAAGKACKVIRQVSCAELVAETIARISREDSVSTLFTDL
jgi:ribose-phosphate pyrophosphokinase